MANTINELDDETKAVLLKQGFRDYYLIERERKIQDTITGETSFHTKTIEQAFREINDAIEQNLWEKLK